MISFLDGYGSLRLKEALTQEFAGVAFERFAKVGMSDRDHAGYALGQRLSAQFGGAELGYDDIGVATGGGDRTAQARDDAAEFAVAGRRGHRDHRAATVGELGTAHEIALAAHGTELRANFTAVRMSVGTVVIEAGPG